jgi:hypothetical protein
VRGERERERKGDREGEDRERATRGMRDGIAWSDRTVNSTIVRRRLAFLLSPALASAFGPLPLCRAPPSALPLLISPGKRLPGCVVVTVRRTALH